jgi:alkanesulfonate monooxygenase
MRPRLFVSGASDECLRTREALGATRLTYPYEIGSYHGETPLRHTGVGFGIIARDDAARAWEIARRRFPPDDLGEELHELTATRAESRWLHQLSSWASQRAPSISVGPADCYWLYPFRSNRTYFPYLVGSYAEVAEMLSGYLGLGAIVLDGLIDDDDLPHTAIALGQARAMSQPAL